MTKTKSTKRALISSALALVICITMLIGTTFAWFTDSVTSANNIIKAGNLDVELEYSADMVNWTAVNAETNVFKDAALWEPGYTEVVYLRVSNKGSLALKYNLGVNVARETPGVNKAGNTFFLSDYIEYGVVKDVAAKYADRTAARAAVTSASKLNTVFNSGDYSLKGVENSTVDKDVFAMVVYMPETVGNEANHNGTAPTINLGINLFATQFTSEEDSFGKDYDEQAPEITIEVTPENIQEYLDGKHGNLSYATLKLAAGNYDTLYLGRPTKYAGSNTAYTCATHDFATSDATQFKSHLAEAGYHTTPQYTTYFKNVTIEGTDGATIAGMVVTSGHNYGAGYDYVLDKEYAVGSISYNTLVMENVTFKNVAFTAKIDMNTSQADSVYDGITFDSCSFTTGGTEQATNGAAIRYYNEINNGNVRNLTVKNSTFENCFQGVYVQNVNGVTITGNKFDTTGHNAIALQSTSEAVNLKTVIIKNNVFKNIGDRVLRFGDVGADSNITLEYNLATNSGDEANEAVKATTIAAGAKIKADYNNWGGTVVNPELRDTLTADLVADASDLKSTAEDTNKSGEIVVLEDIEVEDLTYVNFAKDTTVSGNGNSLVRDTASGNPLFVDTTNKVTFEDFVFESTKGSAVLATRKDGANIEVNNCVFQNNSAPSTGSTGVQVYANNVTMVFNNCTFNNMPIVTNTSHPEGIKLVFNNCTFNWNGDNCPGLIQIANNLKIDVDINGCKFAYTTNSQYTTAKCFISYNWPEASTIDFNGFEVVGTRNNDKIWKICSSNNNVTVNTSGTLKYTFNGEEIDFNTYLK